MGGEYKREGEHEQSERPGTGAALGLEIRLDCNLLFGECGEAETFLPG